MGSVIPNEAVAAAPLTCGGLGVLCRLTQAAFEALLLELGEASRELLSLLLEGKT